MAIAAFAATLLGTASISRAESSVAVEGHIKVSAGGLKIGNPAAARVGNPSELRMTDDSSRVQLTIREGLGDGLSAVVFIDWKVLVDAGVDVTSGDNYVGLESRKWGRIVVGRHDVHYVQGGTGFFFEKADVRAVPGSLLAAMQDSSVPQASGGQSPIANAAATPNLIHYLSPTWGGFRVLAAYSTNPDTLLLGLGPGEKEIGSAVRRGRGWTFAPSFRASNWRGGYSFWDQMNDGAGFHQRSQRIYGRGDWGALRLGFTVDSSWLRSDITGVTRNRRTAWSVASAYQFGPHNLYGHYTRAGNDTVTPASDGAKMWAVAYAYDFSRRTSVAVTAARIDNDPAGQYNFFLSSHPFYGSLSGAVLRGESPRMLTTTIRHVF